ncbi:hypothetical protein ZWY2020_053019 [Hordeum vulgare]|nr:hypothetical protein ZWY2020_053019 [Hordeum vulgare]
MNLQVSPYSLRYSIHSPFLKLSWRFECGCDAHDVGCDGDLRQIRSRRRSRGRIHIRGWRGGDLGGAGGGPVAGLELQVHGPALLAGSRSGRGRRDGGCGGGGELAPEGGACAGGEAEADCGHEFGSDRGRRVGGGGDGELAPNGGPHGAAWPGRRSCAGGKAGRGWAASTPSWSDLAWRRRTKISPPPRTRRALPPWSSSTSPKKRSSLPEKVTSALLLGSFVALVLRSSEQQGEIEELEARKSSLRAANSAMSSTMWVWREELFKLSAMPSLPITVAPLRHIYGEEDLAIPALKPSELGLHIPMMSFLK